MLDFPLPFLDKQLIEGMVVPFVLRDYSLDESFFDLEPLSYIFVASTFNLDFLEDRSDFLNCEV